MRICLICKDYRSGLSQNGSVQFYRLLARGLKQIGHEPELIAVSDADLRDLEREDFPVHRVLLHSLQSAMTSRQLPYLKYCLESSTALSARFFELHLREPFDIVEAPDFAAQGLGPALLRPVPLVVRAFGPHAMTGAATSEKGSRFDDLAVNVLERLALVSADGVICMFKEVADFLSTDINYPREMVKTAVDIVDTQRFSPEGGGAAAKIKALTVLYAGGLGEEDGVGYLIDAVPKVAKKFPLIRFVILHVDGDYDGIDKAVTDLAATLARYGCRDKVEFVLKPAPENLPGYYRSADLCVFPSLSGRADCLLQAMACGRPSISTVLGKSRDYLEHEKNGLLIRSIDVDGIASAILRLAESPDERASLGLAARRSVTERHSPEAVARASLSTYKEATALFEKSCHKKLYTKNAAYAQGDLEMALHSFDRMLYDLVYSASPEFRFKHRLTRIKAASRHLLVALTVKAMRISPLKKLFPNLFSRLQAELGRQSQ